MTCSRPIARTGPLSARANSILREMSTNPLFSASRAIEIALAAREHLPASLARLFEDVSHVNTSGVIVSSKRALTNLMASRVYLELSVDLTDNAPNFAALVASSWNTMASV
jgi:hypothetical protein